jgi:hypothetical protein
MKPQKRSRPEAEQASKPADFQFYITSVVDKEIKRVLKTLQQEEDFQIGRRQIERSKAR